MDFFLGFLGFLGFESLRIYKAIVEGIEPYPEKYGKIYLVSLFIIGILSGSIAYLLDLVTPISSIYVGFSVPSSLKAFIAKQEKSENFFKTIEVDDFEVAPIGKDTLNFYRKTTKNLRIFFKYIGSYFN